MRFCVRILGVLLVIYFLNIFIIKTRTTYGDIAFQKFGDLHIGLNNCDLQFIDKPASSFNERNFKEKKGPLYYFKPISMQNYFSDPDVAVNNDVEGM